MTSASSLADLDAVEARRLIGRKQISPVELLDACLARIDALNPAINAVVARCDDRARAEAKAAEKAVMAGDDLPPLHGLPIGIKDLELTEGVRTTWGSPLFADHVPAADQRSVVAIRKAGAIVVGKTNVPEFGAGANTNNPVYGATRNPYDLKRKRICGGSSGGSAVALACRMLPLCSGSDTGGSLRIPAGFNGIVGYRPSPGLVPNERRPFGFSPLSVLGPMGRSVADAALLLSAMVAEDPRDPLSHPVDAAAYARPAEVALGGLRVAISADLGFAPIEPVIRDTFGKAVGQFRHVFREAVDADPPLDGVDWVFEVLRGLQFITAHGENYRKHKDKLGPNIIANVEQGLGYGVQDVARATAEQTTMIRRMSAFMADFDVLICPTNSTPPFPIEQLYLDVIDGKPTRTYFHWIALTYGLTVVGNPAVSLPCGLDPTGTPFGIQICGRAGADRQVLAVAAALESYLQTIPSLARTSPDLAAIEKMG